ncbi:MAG: GNAT family N-acetyltransferase [Bacteroidota bacterium]
MNIKVSDKIDKKSYDRIVELLNEYNLSKGHKYNSKNNKPLEIVLRDNDNEIIGGLFGRSLWETLEIKTLAVNPENRNMGLGKRLLDEAEKEAIRRSCRYITLDTFSFQAPEFYEKNGFEKIGTESDFPKGFERYYYRKKIQKM